MRNREDRDTPGVDCSHSYSRFGTGGHCRHGEGSVRSSTPWRNRGGDQPRADREGSYSRQRWHRAVPDRGSAAGHLHGDVYFGRVQHVQTGRRRVDRHVHRDHQRRAQGGLTRGNDHRHRREPGRGCTEREAGDDAEQRCRQGHPDRPELQRDGQRRAGRHHELERCRDRNGHDAVSDSWRPKQRGPSHSRWAEYREPPGRQPAALLHRRRRERRGSLVHDVRGLGRVGDSRAGDEHRAENRRQHHPRLGVLQRQRRKAAVRQLQRHPAVRRPRGTHSADEGVRPQRGRRWSDQKRSRVVLRQRAHAGQHANHRERVLQPECGRPDKVDVCARYEPAGVPGPDLRERERAGHVAGDHAQQDRRVLGRTGELPELRGIDHRHHRSATSLAGGPRRGRHQAASRAASDLVVARDEPAASGRRLRRRVLRLGQLRAEPEPHSRSHRRRRAMRGGLCREWRHPGPGLPLAGLRAELCGLVQLEGVGLVRDRETKPENRVPGYVDD